MPNLSKKNKQQPFCTACKKGLVYVAKIIMHEDEDAMKKLALCGLHRKLLIETVNNVFMKEAKECRKN